MKLKKRANPVEEAGAALMLRSISEGLLHPSNPAVVTAVKTKVLSSREVASAFRRFRETHSREDILLRRSSRA